MSTALLCGHCGALLDFPPMQEQRFILWDHWADSHRDALLDGTLTTSLMRVPV